MGTLHLNGGHACLYSPEDEAMVLAWPWWATTVTGGKTYAMRSQREGGRSHTIYLHRMIANAAHGQIVDHINGDSLDNRRENLRIVDASLNCVNRRREPPISGYRGVYPRRSRFYAALWHRRVKHSGGSFARAEDAARAYDRMAREHFGDVAILNFPGER